MMELAVAVPILLLLVVGVADYARVYYTGITVANAAQAGANFGINTDATSDQLIAAAQLDAGNIILDTISAGRFCRCPDTGVVDCVTGDCGAYGTVQEYDSVRVRKDVAMLIRYIGLPESVPVIRTVVLRIK